METRIAIALAFAAAGVGFSAGWALAASDSTTPQAAATREVATKQRADRLRAGEDPWTERDRQREEEGALDPDRSRAAIGPPAQPSATDDVVDEPHGDSDADDDADGDTKTVAERKRRQRELVRAGESCLELLGEPVEEPKEVHERFSGPAVSGAVREAIGQTGVAGDVEGVDCSEFPCIVFARLVGDEEDIEEIERSAALDQYEGDVLTLLLWATTTEPETRTHPTAKETGLFAIAYYDFDDRADAGTDLDRRIRARVLEVWNEERPGPPGSAPTDPNR